MDLKYKGEKVSTIGNIVKIMSCLSTQEEAQEFLAWYKSVNPECAEENLGYITGYFSDKEGEKLRTLLGVEHPVYKFAPDDPIKAARYGFYMGIEIAQSGKNSVTEDMHQKVMDLIGE